MENLLKPELEQIIKKSPLLVETLNRVQNLGIDNYYIGAGCIVQTIWNHLYDMPANYGIKDIDFVYFDSNSMDETSENQVIEKVKEALSDLAIDIDVKNQARVHLWYHKKFGKVIEPYESLEDAIDSWPTTATALGIRLNEDQSLAIYAPYGLEDLFNGVIRANKKLISKDVFVTKSESWQKKWPALKIIDWENQ